MMVAEVANMADTLGSGIYESASRVSPGGAVFEEILRGLRSEKEAVDKKFDAAIAAVTALVPQDVDVRVKMDVRVADADVTAFEMKAPEVNPPLKDRIVDHLARRALTTVSERSLRETLRVGEPALTAAIDELVEQGKVVRYVQRSRGRTGTAAMIRLRPQVAEKPSLGKSKSVKQLSDSQKAVFKVVRRRDAKPLTIRAIARATKLKRDHVVVILSEITRRGLIRRVGRGLYAQ